MIITTDITLNATERIHEALITVQGVGNQRALTIDHIHAGVARSNDVLDTYRLPNRFRIGTTLTITAPSDFDAPKGTTMATVALLIRRCSDWHIVQIRRKSARQPVRLATALTLTGAAKTYLHEHPIRVQQLELFDPSQFVARPPQTSS